VEKYTNEYDKECYKGVTENSPFSADLFHYPEWQPKDYGEYSLAFHSELGSITVLSRMTGFGYMDIETGYRTTDGKFWLASAGFDIRDKNVKTVGEAIELIKLNANACVGE